MKQTLSLLVLLLSTAAFAHDGHGIFDPTTPLHYLGTAEHAVPLAVIALVAVWFFRRKRQRTTD